MDARASAKYLRGSPQKARLVIDMIRGKRVGEALAILQYTNKRAANGIEKCLRSAIANATEAAERQNVAVDPDDLFVKACFVDDGPTKHRRRVRPAPQGRAYREQRHFCHVTVLVSNDGREDASARTGKSAGKGSKKAASGSTGARPSATRKGSATKAAQGSAATAADNTATKPAAESAPQQATSEETTAQE